jgi:hypothetical protein
MRDEWDEAYNGTVFTFGAEAKAAGDELVAEVRAKLPVRDDEDQARLIDVIVLSLWHDYSVGIEQVLCDQWFGIEAQHYDGKLRCWVQCDSLVYGLAAVWQACHERLPSSHGIERGPADE